MHNAYQLYQSFQARTTEPKHPQFQKVKQKRRPTTNIQEAAVSMAPKKRKVPTSSSNATTESSKSTKSTVLVRRVPPIAASTSSNHLSLLSPQLFEESIAKLNLHILPSVVNPKNTRQQNCSFEENREIELTKNDHDRHDNPQILCTKEAMEILRHCHGKFIALLSSELVSCYCQTCGKESSSCACDDDEDGGGGAKGDSIKTIMPKHVKMALERLDFQQIVSSPKFNDIYTRIMAQGWNKTKKTTNTTESTRIKKAVKNSANAQDLLKEQERLFAMSAAKMKEASGLGKLKE